MPFSERYPCACRFDVDVKAPIETASSAAAVSDADSAFMALTIGPTPLGMNPKLPSAMFPAPVSVRNESTRHFPPLMTIAAT